MTGTRDAAARLLSGLCVSLIGNERCAKLPNGRGRYYADRALRRSPVHWTMLLMYVAAYVLSGTPSFPAARRGFCARRTCAVALHGLRRRP